MIIRSVTVHNGTQFLDVIDDGLHIDVCLSTLDEENDSCKFGEPILHLQREEAEALIKILKETLS